MPKSQVNFRIVHNSIPYDISFNELETIQQLRIFILCITGKLSSEPIKNLASKNDRLKQTFKDNDARNGKSYMINLGGISDDKIAFAWIGPWDECKSLISEPVKIKLPVPEPKIVHKPPIPQIPYHQSHPGHQGHPGSGHPAGHAAHQALPALPTLPALPAHQAHSPIQVSQVSLGPGPMVAGPGAGSVAGVAHVLPSLQTGSLPHGAVTSRSGSPHRMPQVMPGQVGHESFGQSPQMHTSSINISQDGHDGRRAHSMQLPPFRRSLSNHSNRASSPSKSPVKQGYLPKNTTSNSTHFTNNMSMSNLNSLNNLSNQLNASMNGMNTINLMTNLSAPSLVPHHQFGSNHSLVSIGSPYEQGPPGPMAAATMSVNLTSAASASKIHRQNSKGKLDGLKKKRNRTSSRDRNLKKKGNSNDKLDWAMEDHEVKIYDWDPPIVDHAKGNVNIRWKDKGNKSKTVKLVGGWINWKCRDATKLEFDEKDKFWKAVLPKEVFIRNMEAGEKKVEFKFIINDKKWLMSEFYRSCKDKSGNMNNYLDF